METLQLRSQVGADGQIHIQLPEQLANQEIELVLVYQASESATQQLAAEHHDPLVALFADTHNLEDSTGELL
jgi:hypothetical protein